MRLRPLEPLQRGQIAFAEAGTGNTLIGMAVWARVSDSVNATIIALVEAGTFPVQLAANEWVSGETIWLLDLIVPSRKAGTAVFTNFTKVIGEKPFKLHPVVAGSLGADLVAQINSLAAAPGAAKPSATTDSKTGRKASSDPLNKDGTQ